MMEGDSNMKKRFWFLAGVVSVVLAIQVKNAVFIDYKVEASV